MLKRGRKAKHKLDGRDILITSRGVHCGSYGICYHGVYESDGKYVHDVFREEELEVIK